MTKGWSVDLLGGLLFLLIARLSLHLGGFWESRSLRWIEEELPILAFLFTITSIKRRQEEVSHADLPPMQRVVIAVLVVTVRGPALVLAVVSGVYGVLAIITAFFGGPLTP